jgi:hypothetical protein
MFTKGNIDQSGYFHKNSANIFSILKKIVLSPGKLTFTAAFMLAAYFPAAL